MQFPIDWYGYDPLHVVFYYVLRNYDVIVCDVRAETIIFEIWMRFPIDWYAYDPLYVIFYFVLRNYDVIICDIIDKTTISEIKMRFPIDWYVTWTSLSYIIKIK